MTRRIAMFAGGAMILLLGAWFMLLWSPKGSELSDARERNAAAEQKASELKVKVDRLKDAQRRSPELLVTRDLLVSAVPEHAELAQFILDTNDVAAKTGVDFLSITPGKPAPSKIPGGPPAISLKLAVKGDYFATLDFLDRLAELRRIVVVDRVQLHPGEDGKLSADLGGSIFTTQAPAGAVVRTARPGTSTASSTTTTTVKP